MVDDMAGEPTLEARSKELHGSSLVIDAVNRVVMDERFLDDATAGGVTVLGRTIMTSDPGVLAPWGYDESLREITAIKAFVAEHQDRCALVRSVDDIDDCKAAGKVGMYVYFQSPEPLADQLWRLHLFYELGLRVQQITYNQRALTGDGSLEPTDAGLSLFGKELIRECNALGIAIDVSHCGDRTKMETIKYSDQPVLISHSNARGLYDHPRLSPDDIVRECASRGGVVGVQAMPVYLEPERPTLDDLIDHMDYYVQLVGADHVSLGMDFITGHGTDDFASLLHIDPKVMAPTQSEDALMFDKTVVGISTMRDMPNITAKLIERGYSDDDIRGILGANLRRVFDIVWKR